MSFYGTLVEKIEETFSSIQFKNSKMRQDISKDAPPSFSVVARSAKDNFIISLKDRWLSFSQPPEKINQNEILLEHSDPEEIDEEKYSSSLSLNNADISLDEAGSDFDYSFSKSDKKGHLNGNKISGVININVNNLRDRVKENEKIINGTTESEKIDTLKTEKKYLIGAVNDLQVKVNNLNTAVRYRGSVQSKEDLLDKEKEENLKHGDVYHVIDAGTEFLYTGKVPLDLLTENNYDNWIELGNETLVSKMSSQLDGFLETDSPTVKNYIDNRKTLYQTEYNADTKVLTIKPFIYR